MTGPETIETARRALGRQLAAHRNAVGYTQQGLANELGYSRSTIANVERGAQRVLPEFWRHCDVVLGAGGELVAAADDIETMRRQHRRRASAEANAARQAKAAALRAAQEAASAPRRPEAPPERDSRLVADIPGHNLGGGSHLHAAEEDDVERRALLQLLATLGVGAAIPVDAMERLRSGLESSIGPNSDLSLEDWQQIAWEYGYTVVGQPPRRVVADLAVDIYEVRRLLRRTHDPLARAGVMGVSAQLSAWMAEELHSLGMYGQAWRWWRTARTAADQSKDRDLRVWVRASEASNAVHSARPVTSVLTLADEAVHIAGGAPSRGLATAQKNRAYVFMRQGDEAGARAALGDMRRSFERLPPRDTSDVDSMWGWPERMMYMADSYVYTSFGAPEAASAQERALSLFPPHWRTQVTRVRLFQAITLIDDGDISSGLEHALSTMIALPDDDHRRRPSILTAASQLLDVLPDERARALPKARELQTIVSP